MPLELALKFGYKIEKDFVDYHVANINWMKWSTILYNLSSSRWAVVQIFTSQEMPRGLHCQVPKPYSFLELAKHSHSVAEFSLLFVPVFGREAISHQYYVKTPSLTVANMGQVVPVELHYLLTVEVIARPTTFIMGHLLQAVVVAGQVLTHLQDQDH